MFYCRAADSREIRIIFTRLLLHGVTTRVESERPYMGSTRRMDEGETAAPAVILLFLKGYSRTRERASERASESTCALAHAPCADGTEIY